ncbi:MAG: hydantoinase/oxoprolinase family protein [Burkholderiaceae bacterium]
MAEHSKVRVAVDIGGTFTDLHLHDPRNGVTIAWKTPSTPDDPSIGLIKGLKEVSAAAGLAPSQIGLILHGSTIATNAVLERKLPRGALITTQGFRDVLEIGRHIRRDVYTLKAEPRALLIPRQHRHEVRERVTANGNIETPLNESDVQGVLAKLREEAIETVAIMFLHGYRNPVHEQRVAQMIREQAPELSVATSFESSPEIREFERVSTTVLNALLRPVISGYLERVSSRLEGADISAALYLVQSNGGLATPADAAALPAKLLLSGPAGGAMAMAALAQRHDIGNLVGFDMGGTSSDISVVREGRIGETAESSIDGLPVRLPMVEVRTIGAGGGSLARVESGALRVGPQSAGAQPGPACYSRGGQAPTVTDANAALGRIDAQGFRTGGMTLNVQAARDALDQHIATPLGMTESASAEGVLDVATAHMAGAIRLSLFEKGADPSDFALAPFGGAAGLHACAVASELGMSEIIFPMHASTLSALGILNADLRYDLLQSQLLPAVEKSLNALIDAVATLRDQANQLLQSASMAADTRRIEFSCDVRYRGQAFELNTRWPELDAGAVPEAASLNALIDHFHDQHELLYAYCERQDPVEIVAVRAMAIGVLDKPDRPLGPRAPDAAESTQRSIVLSGQQIKVPVYRREALKPNEPPISGPLVLEEDFTVLIVEPGWQVRVLDQGDVHCFRAGEVK